MARSLRNEAADLLEFARVASPATAEVRAHRRAEEEDVHGLDDT